MKNTKYEQLFTRNWPIISKETQEKISRLKVGIAGVGSTGGAFADGAFRLGVKNFRLADNGDYELSNLNRQMVDVSAINQNKATFYGNKFKGILPESEITVYNEGLNDQNIKSFVDGLDFLFDAVDVTTAEGIEMKLKLHEYACEHKLFLLSALDLGFTQWVRAYDYRVVRSPLNGKLDEAKKAKHPLLAILGPLCPLEDIPDEAVEEVIRLVKTPNSSACQLGTACFLLSAAATPYLSRFVYEQPIPEFVRMDIQDYFLSEDEKKLRGARKQELLKELSDLIKNL